METTKLIFTDLVANSNKFWTATQDGATVRYTWGRVGDAGQVTVKNFADDLSARKDYDRKLREKLGKGYTRQQTVGASTAPAVAGNLRAIAQEQITTDGSADTRTLIDFLVRRNIHTIEGATDIRFDATTGQLTTPLGPVTTEGLDAAEALLNEIGHAVLGTRGVAFTGLVNQYLRIVPAKIARRAPRAEDIFPDARAVRAQKQLLDTMRTVVVDATTKALSSAPAVFKTKLTAVDSTSAEFARIRKLYEGTKNSRHTSAGLKLKRVFAIEVDGAEAAYAADGAKVGNVMELWHGTKDSNLLSLLRSGYIVPRRGGTAAITGRMYGDGIYFSDQSTKSLNYASGYWGARSQRCFMLLNDVAMGKAHYPTSSFSGGCKPGTDSTFAKAGRSGVINNEMIVYRTSQIRPKYLCEFE